jgi:hypothetical protein
MAANLKIRKDLLESEFYYEYNGGSRKVVLKDATQEQLKQIFEVDPSLFEKPEKEK